MNIRYAKPIDKEQVVSVWNYCFEDGEDFVKYYFENVYDENNTIISLKDILEAGYLKDVKNYHRITIDEAIKRKV